MLCGRARRLGGRRVTPEALDAARAGSSAASCGRALAEPPGPATHEVERLGVAALEHHSNAGCAAPRCSEPADRHAATTVRDASNGLPATHRSSVMAKPDLMDRVVNLAKRRGLVFPSSEIYGGFRSTWDYGPLGVLLKRNVKDAWWRAMVQLRDDIVGLDAAILMAPKVWEASGHLATFTDPLVDCRNCKERFRADQLPESGACPNCGAKDSFTEARQFNLMFKTYVGPVEDDAVGRLPAPRDRAGHLRQLQERADDDAQEAAVRHRADRQVVPQRDHARATSSSAPASSSRWRWSTSCRPTTATRGTSTGARSGSAGTSTSASPRRSCACGRTTPTSCRTTRSARPTSSSCTRGAGASSRASPTAPTSTSRQHAKFSGRGPHLLRPGARPPLRAAT